MLEPPKLINDNLYEGSRRLTWLADLSGLSVDLVNFLFCQIAAIFVASLYRSILHPSKVSSAVRHAFAMTLGLAMCYFCFGQQAIHIAGLPAICYVLIRTQDPRIVQRNVLLVAMGYLLCIHLMRQIYDYGSYALDITGPLMIITQKVTTLSFSIHDGFVRQDEQLTKAQQYHAIQKMPTALEFFSYVWHFQSIMAGPLVFYKDYIDFIEGYNLLMPAASNGSFDKGRKELVLEPSPTKAVVKKTIGSLICALIFMKFVKIYPVKVLTDDAFLNGTTIAYKLWYTMIATTCVRFKYYHAWLLGDAICNNSGLGFTGYDKDGNAKWDLISNINVLGFEFATNMRDAINNWNCGTNRWLRILVYERVPKKYGTLLTFTLSAIWHGFYPGYYITFATGALIVTAARTARRVFRHRFQSTQFTRMFYDILTCLTTRIVMGYATFPFVLLEFMGSIRLYLKFYLCLHIISLASIYILPRLIEGDAKRAKQKVDDAAAAAVAVAAETKREHNNGGGVGDGIEASIADLKCDSLAVKCAKFFNDKKTAPKMNAMIGVGCARDAVSVQHDQCEMDQLSTKLKEKFDAETKNIEDFIDKTVNETVCGIVGFKNDFMRDLNEFPNTKTQQQQQQEQQQNNSGLRKRNAAIPSSTLTPVTSCIDNDMNEFNGATIANTGNTGNAGNAGSNGATTLEDSAAFLKKEIDVINSVVQQANVLPAVISNGHAK